MTAVRFTFDECDALGTFNGLSDGSTWNGFDNVSVTPAVHAQVLAYFAADPESLAAFDGLTAGVDGFVSYANGFATQVEQATR